MARAWIPRLSVGTKWALRYAVAILFAVSALSLYVYGRVERRIERDAELIVAIPLRNVSEGLHHYGNDRARMEELIDREVKASDPDLRLGIQLFDSHGEPLVEKGILAERPLPLHPAVASGSSRWKFYEADLGGSAPFYVVATTSEDHGIQVAVYGRRFARNAKFIADGFLLALPVAVIVAVGLGWLLARGSLRPIARITATARRIGGSNLEEAVPTSGSGDELDQLAVTFNTMLARIRQSMQRVRRFSGDAAHELRTPLTAIRNQIEVMLEKERTPAEYAEVLGRMLDEVERLAEGVDGMLRLAQLEGGLDPASCERVDLRELLATVVDFFEPLASERELTLVLQATAEPVVVGDASWLHQLFANLVHNATKFTEAGGSIEVALDVVGDEAVVRVSDTGIGIDPEHADRIFQRFHKVDDARSEAGFGLGLTLVREFTRVHGGEVTLQSAPGRGSTFEVRLPLADAA